MRVALLSTYDTEGGASRAAYRLHDALRTASIDSAMVVGEKKSMDRHVYGPADKFGKGLSLLRPEADKLPLLLYPKKRPGAWSLAWFPHRIEQRVARYQPDLIHLHWVGFGYMPVQEMRRFKVPVIWTLHDMWPFTGGCHYSGECAGYVGRCGHCPQLNSSRKYDLSSWLHSRKTRLWQDIPLTIVSPSLWLAERARSSSLFAGRRIEVLPNAIDVNLYKPMEKRVARQLLNIPPDAQVIMFAAIDGRAEERKGYRYLKEALSMFSDGGQLKNVSLLAVGVGEPDKQEFHLPVHYLGRVYDDMTMVAAYSAADVFVSPSTEDNLPNTVMEAMACGTPCVTFNLGGFPDLIKDGISGYLAPSFDPSELASGISRVLSDPSRHRLLSEAARAKVIASYDSSIIAGRHISLYQDVLEKFRHE